MGFRQLGFGLRMLHVPQAHADVTQQISPGAITAQPCSLAALAAGADTIRPESTNRPNVSVL